MGKAAKRTQAHWVMEQRWGIGGKPLPRKVVTAPVAPTPASPWWNRLFARDRTPESPSGVPHAQSTQSTQSTQSAAGFDFSARMRLLCEDISTRCPELGHIDSRAVLYTVTPSRSRNSHGLLARVTPMRFRDGQLTRRFRGVVYQVQRYYHDGQELLYLVTFALPRFLNQSFEEKLITIVHELYHISERFNGDIRRHPGRYSAHSHSTKEYDRRMAVVVREYLRTGPSPALYDWLRLSNRDLVDRSGPIHGAYVPRPKLIPIGRINTEST